ncbi:MAG: hypothetical protein QXE95_07480 [Candidatus Nitrosocaldus sp.]
MARKFMEWWNSIPADIRNKAKGNDDWSKYKPLLNQINYAMVALHLQGNHSMKPTSEELLSWIKNGEIDVVRMTK